MLEFPLFLLRYCLISLLLTSFLRVIEKITLFFISPYFRVRSQVIYLLYTNIHPKEAISQEEIKKKHEWYENYKKKNPKISKYFAMPILTIINEKYAHVSLGDDNMTANKHAFLDEGAEIYAGYFTLAVGIELIRRKFFSLDMLDYDLISENHFQNKNPGRILYIDGISENDPIKAAVNANFVMNYHDHPNIDRYFVTNYDEFLSVLKDAHLSNIKYDRIVIYAHGKSGKMLFSNESQSEGKILNIKNLEKLRKLNLDITNPNAEVQFISCSLGVDLIFCNNGTRFLDKFGEVVLASGGTVMAPTRNISSSKKFNFINPETGLLIPEVPYAIRPRIQYAYAHIIGLGNFMLLWNEILFNGISRNYLQSLKKIKVRTITARKENLCPNSVETFL